MEKNIVEMKNIKKTFGNVEALRGVNLYLKEGEVLGLVRGARDVRTACQLDVGQHPRLDHRAAKRALDEPDRHHALPIAATKDEDAPPPMSTQFQPPGSGTTRPRRAGRR